MKTYYDYMNEISSDELFEGLLGYGLFTDKIPDIFTSEMFYDYCKNKISRRKYEQKGRDYVRYETMRNTNTIRNLAIPSPFAYANLCLYISNNWDKFQIHFKNKANNQDYKRSRIHIQKICESKCIFKMSHSYKEKDQEIENIIQKLPITKRYRVEADISSCFPSMYSHALAWALVGKEEAKKNKDKKELWFNILDFYSRNIKNEETNGLLIGPHSSNLLSEIILTCIDDKLCSNYQYYRNIDDFTCYTQSEEDAERFLLDLSQALKDFELTLNIKKLGLLNYLFRPNPTGFVHLIAFP